MRYRFTVETCRPITVRGKLLQVAFIKAKLKNVTVLEDLVIDSPEELDNIYEVLSILKQMSGFVRFSSWDKLDFETREPDIWFQPLQVLN